MIWPGLNSPVIQGKELVQQRQLPSDPDFHNKLVKIRDSMVHFGIFKIDPLERGWSGTNMPGTKIGAPDRVGEGMLPVYNFYKFTTSEWECSFMLVMSRLF